MATQTRQDEVTLVRTWRRQWQGYVHYHRSRSNLLLHAVAVPVFLAGNIGVVLALPLANPWFAAFGVAATAASLAAQGIGHRRETEPPEPFTGAGNAIARILLEQWVTFPRFVLSGRWWRAWHAHGPC